MKKDIGNMLGHLVSSHPLGGMKPNDHTRLVRPHAMPSETQRFISVIGAAEHNLKNIAVEIPRDSLTVIAGISGSGPRCSEIEIPLLPQQIGGVETLRGLLKQQFNIPVHTSTPSRRTFIMKGNCRFS